MKSYIKDYPRPQFVRKDWMNLNGLWDFAFDDKNIGEKEKWYKSFHGDLQIQVPFTYETKLSGIQDESRHDNIWYRRTIEVDGNKLNSNRFVIHFEGSDYYTKLWVNGQYAGSHRGGYARFSFDISDLVRDGVNELVVKVEDSFDQQQPRGKQRWSAENFRCWYVQTTGIWKTVWTEFVPNVNLDYVKMTPNIQDFCMELEVDVNVPEELLDGQLLLEIAVSFEGRLVSRSYVTLLQSHMKTNIDLSVKDDINIQISAKTWSPEHPYLYDVVFRIVDGDRVWDEVGSYFAMREVRIEGSKVLLNGRPLYQRLILDQGYWRDSHLTPPSEEALIEDIDRILAMGYNGLRKHQKIEDERFLYWCDVKGVLVWSEAAAAYQFTDTAINMFTAEWMEIVKQNYNHPCIITWTPFNESWGIERIKTCREQQAFTEAIYYLTKSMDKTRPVIVNDGWEHTVSDILTLHDYEVSGAVFNRRYSEYKEEIQKSEVFHNRFYTAFAEGYEYKGQPVIISEFGGIAYDNGDSGWGYGGKESTVEKFIQRFDDITTAIKDLPYVCGYCYTQVTDVQQEINGLMDIDRNFKIKPEIVYEINTRKRGIL